MRTLHVGLLPFFEYVFLPGDPLRPALAGGVGLVFDELEVAPVDPEGAPTRTTTEERLAWVVSFSVRLHVFLAPSFSIAPSAFVRYSDGVRARPFFVGGALAMIDFDESNLVAGLGIELAGWVGRPPVEAEPDRDAIY